MKIEFLEFGSDDCPLLRIYGNEPSVCEKLRLAFMDLSNGSASEVVLTQLQGIQSTSECFVIAKSADRDIGVTRSSANAFSWVLTPAGWDDVALLIEPFCGTPDGEFQWLDQRDEIRVLLSTSGSW